MVNLINGNRKVDNEQKEQALKHLQAFKDSQLEVESVDAEYVKNLKETDEALEGFRDTLLMAKLNSENWGKGGNIS